MKPRLVVSAVLALLVATMMVSTVNAQYRTPQEALLALETLVDGAPIQLFRGYHVTYTRQQKDALIRKIDVVIAMMDEGESSAAITKLENDIARKLTICDTQRVRARSWLSTTHNYPEVSAFAEDCQFLINLAIELAD